MNNKLEYVIIRELMSSVLKKAIKDLKLQSDSLEYNNAYNWFKNNGNGYVFSFPSVCDVLNCNLDYLREGIFAKLGLN